jgi:hypothetical protein
MASRTLNGWVLAQRYGHLETGAIPLEKIIAMKEKFLLFTQNHV